MTDPRYENDIREQRALLRQKVTSWRRPSFDNAYPVTSMPHIDEWHQHPVCPGAEVKTIMQDSDGFIVGVDVRWEKSGWVEAHYHPDHVEEIRVTNGHLRLFIQIEGGVDEIELSPESKAYQIPAGVKHITFAYRHAEYRILFHPPMTCSDPLPSSHVNKQTP